MRLVVLKTFGALTYRLAQCVSAPDMSVAPFIFFFLALMDPCAILALLPGGDAVSDHGNLSGDSADAGGDAVSADADGGADAASARGRCGL